jgi:hypothetical protein
MPRGLVPQWAKNLAASDKPLNNWPDRSADFDIRKSEIVKTLLADDRFLAWAYDKATEHMIYDPSTERWIGKDHGANIPPRPCPASITPADFAATVEALGKPSKKTLKAFCETFNCKTVDIWAAWRRWKAARC